MAISNAQGKELELITAIQTDLKSFSDNVQLNMERMKSMPQQIQELHQIKKGWGERWKHGLVFVGAVGFLLVVIQALVQLNILHLAWGSK